MEEDREALLDSPPLKVRRRTGRFVFCFGVTLLITVCLVLAFWIHTSYVSRREPMLSVGALWFPQSGSESCIRLLDIDGDGLDDIIMALTEVTVITNGIAVDASRSEYCRSIGVEYPCAGTIYGIRGYDLKLLWSSIVKQSVFELLCNGIDIDGDGRRDCIGAGRQGTLVAFDPRTGKLLWSGNRISSRQKLWNFYSPLSLPMDVDADGVNDIIISHGGNPTIPAEVHDRETGYLLLISGRTGNQIGEPYGMPDHRETYMSPVLYGRSSILFGSGGETVDGGLYSISIENLINGSNEYVTLFKSSLKGVMVPPVVIDVNNDEHDDILISCFDGTVQLMDGQSLSILWEKVFDGYEFYASPAPGDFNSDGFLDFMFILNHGVWDRYDHSLILVLDGLTGHTLWSKKNIHSEFSSPLSLTMKVNQNYRDAFVYKERGETSLIQESNKPLILLHGIGLQEGEIEKSTDTLPKNVIQCDGFSLNNSMVHIYFSEIQETRLVGTIYPPLKHDQVCTDFEPMERSGGAIGDLNGDGLLDVVDITTFITKVNSHSLDQLTAHAVLTRFTIGLQRQDSEIVAIYQSEISNQSSINRALTDQLKASNRFIPASDIKTKRRFLKKQSWNAYLGREGNSHYIREYVE